MVKAIFKDFVIATAGPNDHKPEELKSWIELRKGRFSLDMDESVTHLLCTEDQFKTRHKNQRIKLAQKGRVRILHIDWFTFSCTHNKKLPESEYNFRAVRKRELARLQKQRYLERRARNTMLGESWINPDLYHVFTDKYHFRYEIQLFRTIEDKDGAIHEKYEASLFESHVKPHLYWFGVKMFQKKGDGVWRPRALDRPSITPNVFQPEFDRFKDFFLKKTKYEWRDRVIMAGTTEKIQFSYSPPTRGKPVGGNLRYLDYDKCVRRNRKIRVLWAELFGDELPIDLAIEVAVKEILEETIDEACVSLECAELCDAIEGIRPNSTAQENSSVEVERSSLGAPEGGDVQAVPGSDELDNGAGIEMALSGFVEPAPTPVSEVAPSSSDQDSAPTELADSIVDKAFSTPLANKLETFVECQRAGCMQVI
ncbi:brct domain-containing protein [Colletotrichum musicola]|uniref:Brct domain-containing protein n=1 Tax=Colletotrichum musicola TaxID=2175873 RepID=A0A8H6NZG6_9PEZI|nr:brct domain-containing protein [Colletotrichum musicola]